MQLRAGRAEAAAAVWRWQDAVEDSGSGEGAGRARLKGLLQATLAAAVGAGLYFWGRTTVATVVFSVAAIVGLSALVSPTGLFRAIEALFAALGAATGRALTWIVVVPLFYVFFLPFGALMRRGRRDRLQRFYEQDASSYWEPHAGVRAASGSRERQY